ncbi:F-box domain cyclin [Fusarium albosuccineum]|uniref:F-box domain cyclin n=1 Tax=Fusarium albosuccineum TaxID=1237068 RepID=A0A8H4KDQ9_9HYPO|nr:F-box domain cyclin [Fusarium albosuccineum]
MHMSVATALHGSRYSVPILRESPKKPRSSQPETPLQEPGPAQQRPGWFKRMKRRVVNTTRNVVQYINRKPTGSAFDVPGGGGYVPLRQSDSHVPSPLADEEMPSPKSRLSIEFKFTKNGSHGRSENPELQRSQLLEPPKSQPLELSRTQLLEPPRSQPLDPPKNQPLEPPRSRLLQLLRSRRLRRSRSKLVQLPKELLLEIMHNLPHSSLYLLRQTCREFFRLSKHKSLADFNAEFSRVQNESFCTSRREYEQRLIIRDTLARASHCNDCNRLRETGALKQKMIELYQPKFCSGCRQHHAALFFAPNQRRTKSEGGAPCLGRIGHFVLCSHKSLAGHDLETIRNARLEEKIICTDRSHLPQHVLARGLNVETDDNFPEMEVKAYYILFLDVTKKSFVLSLDHGSHTTIQDIRQRLSERLQSRPDCRQFCKHVSLQSEQLLDTLTSDACTCFPASGLRPSTSTARHGCKNHKFNCLECGATYFWTLEQGHGPSRKSSFVVLNMKCRWILPSPLCPAWLFNLDYETGSKGKNPVFNKDTKHVLWCDSPGCATGSERRWLRMAKIALSETLDKSALRHVFYAYGRNDLVGDYGKVDVVSEASLEHAAYVESRER